LEQELISCSFAGSPVQLSSVPSTEGTFARFKIRTNAFVIFFALSSKLPAQPTQNSTSGCFPWAAFPPLLALLNSLTFLIFLFS
jgi:hypothetical protein